MKGSSGGETLRLLELVSECQDVPSGMLAEFLNPVIGSNDYLVRAVELAGRAEPRHDGLTIALLQLLHERDGRGAFVVAPALTALKRQFGNSNQRVASLLAHTDCLPNLYTTLGDLVLLAALFREGVAVHINLSSLHLETTLSDAIWTSQSPTLASAALLVARAVCLETPYACEDRNMVLEMLTGVCNHSTARIAATARAIMWETASLMEDTLEEGELVGKLLRMGATIKSSDALSESVHVAGMIAVLVANAQEEPRACYNQLVLAILQRVPSSLQCSALVETFATKHLDLNRAGSALLFAVCTMPQCVSLADHHCSTGQMRAACARLLRILRETPGAVQELCEVIAEHLPELQDIETALLEMFEQK